MKLFNGGLNNTDNVSRYTRNDARLRLMMYCNQYDVMFPLILMCPQAHIISESDIIDLSLHHLRSKHHYKKENLVFSHKVSFLCWHLLIFPGSCPPSIFSASELNFCVRNGNRWTLTAINTNYGASSRTRTYDNSVNSRVLYRLSY